jgi:hypothetical protein
MARLTKLELMVAQAALDAADAAGENDWMDALTEGQTPEERAKTLEKIQEAVRTASKKLGEMSRRRAR